MPVENGSSWPASRGQPEARVPYVRDFRGERDRNAERMSSKRSWNDRLTFPKPPSLLAPNIPENKRRVPDLSRPVYSNDPPPYGLNIHNLDSSPSGPPRKPTNDNELSSRKYDHISPVFASQSTFSNQRLSLDPRSKENESKLQNPSSEFHNRSTETKEIASSLEPSVNRSLSSSPFPTADNSWEKDKALRPKDTNNWDTSFRERDFREKGRYKGNYSYHRSIPSFTPSISDGFEHDWSISSMKNDDTNKTDKDEKELHLKDDLWSSENTNKESNRNWRLGLRERGSTGGSIPAIGSPSSKELPETTPTADTSLSDDLWGIKKPEPAPISGFNDTEVSILPDLIPSALVPAPARKSRVFDEEEEKDVASSSSPPPKRLRLGWGQGLAKYEKKRTEGDEPSSDTRPNNENQTVLNPIDQPSASSDPSSSNPLPLLSLSSSSPLPDPSTQSEHLLSFSLASFSRPSSTMDFSLLKNKENFNVAERDMTAPVSEKPLFDTLDKPPSFYQQSNIKFPAFPQSKLSVSLQSPPKEGSPVVREETRTTTSPSSPLNDPWLSPSVAKNHQHTKLHSSDRVNSSPLSDVSSPDSALPERDKPLPSMVANTGDQLDLGIKKTEGSVSKEGILGMVSIKVDTPKISINSSESNLTPTEPFPRPNARITAENDQGLSHETMFSTYMESGIQTDDTSNKKTNLDSAPSQSIPPNVKIHHERGDEEIQDSTPSLGNKIFKETEMEQQKVTFHSDSEISSVKFKSTPTSNDQTVLFSKQLRHKIFDDISTTGLDSSTLENMKSDKNKQDVFDEKDLPEDVVGGFTEVEEDLSQYSKDAIVNKIEEFDLETQKIKFMINEFNEKILLMQSDIDSKLTSFKSSDKRTTMVYPKNVEETSSDIKPQNAYNKIAEDKLNAYQESRRKSEEEIHDIYSCSIDSFDLQTDKMASPYSSEKDIHKLKSPSKCNENSSPLRKKNATDEYLSAKRMKISNSEDKSFIVFSFTECDKNEYDDEVDVGVHENHNDLMGLNPNSLMQFVQESVASDMKSSELGDQTKFQFFNRKRSLDQRVNTAKEIHELFFQNQQMVQEELGNRQLILHPMYGEMVKKSLSGSPRTDRQNYIIHSIISRHQNPIFCIVEENRKKAESSSNAFLHLFCNNIRSINSTFYSDPQYAPSWKSNESEFRQLSSIMQSKIYDRKHTNVMLERILAIKYRVLREVWKRKQISNLNPGPGYSRRERMSIERSGTKINMKSPSASQNQKSSHRLKASGDESKGDELALARILLNKPFTEPRVILRMPPMILDEKEKKAKTFASKNSLVLDPVREEEERKRINPWSQEEKQIFFEKFLIFSKDFSSIAKFLTHKTVADCVEFYYRNQKSEEFESMRKKQTLRKRREGKNVAYLATNHFSPSTRIQASGSARFGRERGNDSSILSSPSPESLGNRRRISIENNSKYFRSSSQRNQNASERARVNAATIPPIPPSPSPGPSPSPFGVSPIERTSSRNSLSTTGGDFATPLAKDKSSSESPRLRSSENGNNLTSSRTTKSAETKPDPFSNSTEVSRRGRKSLNSNSNSNSNLNSMIKMENEKRYKRKNEPSVAIERDRKNSVERNVRQKITVEALESTSEPASKPVSKPEPEIPNDGEKKEFYKSGRKSNKESKVITNAFNEFKGKPNKSNSSFMLDSPSGPGAEGCNSGNAEDQKPFDSFSVEAKSPSPSYRSNSNTSCNDMKQNINVSSLPPSPPELLLSLKDLTPSIPPDSEPPNCHKDKTQVLEEKEIVQDNNATMEDEIILKEEMVTNLDAMQSINGEPSPDKVQSQTEESEVKSNKNESLVVLADNAQEEKIVTVAQEVSEKGLMTTSISEIPIADPEKVVNTSSLDLSSEVREGEGRDEEKLVEALEKIKTENHIENQGISVDDKMKCLTCTPSDHIEPNSMDQNLQKDISSLHIHTDIPSEQNFENQGKPISRISGMEEFQIENQDVQNVNLTSEGSFEETVNNKIDNDFIPSIDLAAAALVGISSSNFSPPPTLLFQKSMEQSTDLNGVNAGERQNSQGQNIKKEADVSSPLSLLVSQIEAISSSSSAIDARLNPNKDNQFHGVSRILDVPLRDNRSNEEKEKEIGNHHGVFHAVESLESMEFEKMVTRKKGRSKRRERTDLGNIFLPNFDNTDEKKFEEKKNTKIDNETVNNNKDKSTSSEINDKVANDLERRILRNDSKKDKIEKILVQDESKKSEFPKKGEAGKSGKMKEKAKDKEKESFREKDKERGKTPSLSPSEGIKQRKEPTTWSQSEKECFVRIIESNGKDWNMLKEAIPNKSLTQIKTYFQNSKSRLGLNMSSNPNLNAFSSSASFSIPSSSRSSKKRKAETKEDAGINGSNLPKSTKLRSSSRDSGLPINKSVIEMNTTATTSGDVTVPSSPSPLPPHSSPVTDNPHHNSSKESLPHPSHPLATPFVELFKNFHHKEMYEAKERNSSNTTKSQSGYGNNGMNAKGVMNTNIGGGAETILSYPPMTDFQIQNYIPWMQGDMSASFPQASKPTPTENKNEIKFYPHPYFFNPHIFPFLPAMNYNPSLIQNLQNAEPFHSSFSHSPSPSSSQSPSPNLNKPSFETSQPMSSFKLFNHDSFPPQNPSSPENPKSNKLPHGQADVKLFGQSLLQQPSSSKSSTVSTPSVSLPPSPPTDSSLPYSSPLLSSSLPPLRPLSQEAPNLNSASSMTMIPSRFDKIEDHSKSSHLPSLPTSHTTDINSHRKEKNPPQHLQMQWNEPQAMSNSMQGLKRNPRPFLKSDFNASSPLPPSYSTILPPSPSLVPSSFNSKRSFSSDDIPSLERKQESPYPMDSKALERLTRNGMVVMNGGKDIPNQGKGRLSQKSLASFLSPSELYSTVPKGDAAKVYDSFLSLSQNQSQFYNSSSSSGLFNPAEENTNHEEKKGMDPDLKVDFFAMNESYGGKKRLAREEGPNMVQNEDFNAVNQKRDLSKWFVQFLNNEGSNKRMKTSVPSSGPPPPPLELTLSADAAKNGDEKPS